MNLHHEQGDILFVKLDAVPEKKETHKDGGILAHGEVTGHTHALESLKDVDVFLDVNGRLIVHNKSDKAKKVVHQEHGPISLEPGAWEVKYQNEYTPDGWRRVAD